MDLRPARMDFREGSSACPLAVATALNPKRNIRTQGNTLKPLPQRQSAA